MGKQVRKEGGTEAGPVGPACPGASAGRQGLCTCSSLCTERPLTMWLHKPHSEGPPHGTCVLGGGARKAWFLFSVTCAAMSSYSATNSPWAPSSQPPGHTKKAGPCSCPCGDYEVTDE